MVVVVKGRHAGKMGEYDNDAGPKTACVIIVGDEARGGYKLIRRSSLRRVDNVDFMPSAQLRVLTR